MAKKTIIISKDIKLNENNKDFLLLSDVFIARYQPLDFFLNELCIIQSKSFVKNSHLKKGVVVENAFVEISDQKKSEILECNKLDQNALHFILTQSIYVAAIKDNNSLLRRYRFVNNIYFKDLISFIKLTNVSSNNALKNFKSSKNKGIHISNARYALYEAISHHFFIDYMKDELNFILTLIIKSTNTISIYNSKDIFGYTPLYYAYMNFPDYSYYQTLLDLIGSLSAEEQKTIISMQFKDKKNILHYICSFNDFNFFKYVISVWNKGAIKYSFNKVDDNGLSPLHYFFLNSRDTSFLIEILDLLKDAFFNLIFENSIRMEGAFHLVCEVFNIDFITIILSRINPYKAYKVLEPSQKGYNILHYVFYYSNLNLFNFIISLVAKKQIVYAMMARNNRGHTPFYLSLQSQKKEFIYKICDLIGAHKLFLLTRCVEIKKRVKSNQVVAKIVNSYIFLIEQFTFLFANVSESEKKGSVDHAASSNYFSYFRESSNNSEMKVRFLEFINLLQRLKFDNKDNVVNLYILFKVNQKNSYNKVLLNYILSLNSQEIKKRLDDFKNFVAKSKLAPFNKIFLTICKNSLQLESVKLDAIPREMIASSEDESDEEFILVSSDNAVFDFTADGLLAYFLVKLKVWKECLSKNEQIYDGYMIDTQRTLCNFFMDEIVLKIQNALYIKDLKQILMFLQKILKTEAFSFIEAYEGKANLNSKNKKSNVISFYEKVIRCVDKKRDDLLKNYQSKISNYKNVSNREIQNNRSSTKVEENSRREFTF